MTSILEQMSTKQVIHRYMQPKSINMENKAQELVVITRFGWISRKPERLIL